MNYTFNHANYNKFSVYEENKLSPRAYFIPFSARSIVDTTDYTTERYNSDKVMILNGEWDFCYYNKISGMPKTIETEGFDFSKVNVPSCWQFTGYERPYYVNARYQFKPEPPTIPKDIPVSIYRKLIKLSIINYSEILTFLGACSNLELYINGKYVGYSEGSHNSAEFQIAKYLKIGVNEIVALVYKWCNGTYIECQDMFRNNGIFRDVYITHAGESSIFDYYINCEKKAEHKYNINLTTIVKSNASDVRYTMYLGDTQVFRSTTSADSEIQLELDKVLEWTSETPNLYKLYIELINENGDVIECVRDYVGFRNIVIKGNKFTFNDQNIKLYGVNHHDSNEKNGFVMSIADMLQDVKLMKEFNVNCVRTSHYPPDPAFVKMCDHYGIYVVLEADIEAHGVCCDGPYRPNRISNNVAWKDHYWDRVKRAFNRDKNSPSIVMWSLGNESGGYACHDYCYDKLKELTTREPIHYEGVIRTKRWAYDVISQMYTHPDVCLQIAKGNKPSKYLNKPFYLCEYAHAMGVGAGDLDYYVDIFNMSDNMLGGCIWEWCDHAVLHENDDSNYKYTYGGDHGEEKHDKNFCVDGLFYPNRTPHTGAYAMKNIYRPIRVKHLEDNKYSFTNLYRFIDTKNIKIEYSTLEWGKVTNSGTVDIVIPANKTVNAKINYFVNNSVDCYVIFRYIDKITGSEIAFEQVVINEVIGNNPDKKYGVTVNNVSKKLAVTFNGGNIVFSKENGAILTYTHNQHEFINQQPARSDKYQGFLADIYRAPIDNYMNINKVWKRQHLDELNNKFISIECDVDEEKGKAKVNTIFELCYKNKVLFRYTIRYRVYADGTLDIKIKLSSNKRFTVYDLPKFGSTIEMPKCFNTVEYYGMGNKENYSDFNKQSVMGIYDTEVSKMREPYIKPQDSGNRSNVRWAKVTNDEGAGLKFIAIDQPLNFKCHDITTEKLQKAGHLEDAKPMDVTVVFVDNFVRGAGSNSCGPDTREQFRLKLKKGQELSYKFRVTPILD